MHIDFFTHALDARANFEICQILPNSERLEDAHWDAHSSGLLSHGLMEIDQVPALLTAREPLAQSWKQGWLEAQNWKHDSEERMLCPGCTNGSHDPCHIHG
jgi:hypothetical protein